MTESTPFPTEEELRAWTDRINTAAVEQLKPENQQLNDLSSAYSAMDQLIADPLHQFGEQTILDMHTLLSPHIPNIGGYKGKYYLAPRKIRSAVPQSEILPFVQGENKLPAMKQLGENYGQYMSLASPKAPAETVGHATDVITRMSDIHPFLDGNSRTGRLLADSIFLRQGMHQVPLWTDFKMGGIDPKAAFYGLVEKSRRGNPEGLMAVLAQEQINACRAEINAFALDERIGEMPEAKDMVDYQQHLIYELSDFLEKVR